MIDKTFQELRVLWLSECLAQHFRSWNDGTTHRSILPMKCLCFWATSSITWKSSLLKFRQGNEGIRYSQFYEDHCERELALTFLGKPVFSKITITTPIYFRLMTFATFAFALTFTLAFFFSFAALFVVSTLAFCTGSLMKRWHWICWRNHENQLNLCVQLAFRVV